MYLLWFFCILHHIKHIPHQLPENTGVISWMMKKNIRNIMFAVVLNTKQLIFFLIFCLFHLENFEVQTGTLTTAPFAQAFNKIPKLNLHLTAGPVDLELGGNILRLTSVFFYQLLQQSCF